MMIISSYCEGGQGFYICMLPRGKKAGKSTVSATVYRFWMEGEGKGYQNLRFIIIIGVTGVVVSGNIPRRYFLARIQLPEKAFAGIPTLYPKIKGEAKEERESSRSLQFGNFLKKKDFGKQSYFIQPFLLLFLVWFYGG